MILRIFVRTRVCLDANATAEVMMEVIGVAAALGGGSEMSQGVTIWQEAYEDFTGTVH